MGIQYAVKQFSKAAVTLYENVLTVSAVFGLDSDIYLLT